MKQSQFSKLPLPEKPQLNLGYMRLVDSAPILVAKELGYFDRYGLTVDLHREISWANIRDKVIAGVFDAGHMLAPMPLVTTLGAAGIRAPMLTGLMLSLNGNGITVTPLLWEKMQSLYDGALSSEDPLATAQALARVVEDGGESDKLTFATVHHFSTHTLLLRLWLKAAGVDPDQQLKIIVLPPEQMVDSLASGLIDGFCVGEPWNSVAVSCGAGIMATTGYQVWNNAPEKVLGVLEHWHAKHPATHLRLRLALMEACKWLSVAENRVQAIDIMSSCDYLDLPKEYFLPSMSGNILFDRNQAPREHASFQVFSQYNAGFPWRSQAEIILRQCSEQLGKPIEENRLVSLTQQCYRTDLYREAARHLGWPSPFKDHKPEGKHDAPWQFSEDITLGSDFMLAPHIDAAGEFSEANVGAPK